MSVFRSQRITMKEIKARRQKVLDDYDLWLEEQGLPKVRGCYSYGNKYGR